MPDYLPLDMNQKLDIPLNNNHLLSELINKKELKLKIHSRILIE